MMFLYSLKLFCSNFGKALKLFLYYIVIWGLCIALLLPAFFEFSSILSAAFKDLNLASTFSGVFQGSVGAGLQSLINGTWDICKSVFSANMGLAIYALIVIFVILPILLRIGDFTFCEMLHAYMTSKNKLGFFSALVKSLKKSVVYALTRTLSGLVFYAITLFSVFGIAQIQGQALVKYLLPVLLFVALVLLFSVRQIAWLGYMPALIVFDCGCFKAYAKGLKAVKRHFCSTILTTLLYFSIFWLLVMIFGLYCLVVLVPLMAVLMSVYNMVAFFSSQGMRFYVNNEHILTPKKLEEVDNINSTVFIL